MIEIARVVADRWDDGWAEDLRSFLDRRPTSLDNPLHAPLRRQVHDDCSASVAPQADGRGKDAESHLLRVRQAEHAQRRPMLRAGESRHEGVADALSVARASRLSP